jgi:hypothetical protein
LIWSCCEVIGALSFCIFNIIIECVRLVHIIVSMLRLLAVKWWHMDGSLVSKETFEDYVLIWRHLQQRLMLESSQSIIGILYVCFFHSHCETLSELFCHFANFIPMAVNSKSVEVRTCIYCIINCTSYYKIWMWDFAK